MPDPILRYIEREINEALQQQGYAHRVKIEELGNSRYRWVLLQGAHNTGGSCRLTGSVTAVLWGEDYLRDLEKGEKGA